MWGQPPPAVHRAKPVRLCFEINIDNTHSRD
jgi:hypothetical protein